MPTIALSKLLPSMSEALHKLTDDLSAIHSSASWLYSDVEKRLYGARVLEVVTDIQRITDGAFKKVDAIKKVRDALACSREAMELLREIEHDDEVTTGSKAKS